MEEDIPRHEMKIAFFGRGFKKGKLFYLWCKKEITPGALKGLESGAVFNSLVSLETPCRSSSDSYMIMISNNPKGRVTRAKPVELYSSSCR